MMRLNTNAVNQRLVFGDVLKFWLDNNRMTFKGSTLIKYEHLIDTHILPLLGDVEVSTISATMINRFLLHKLENGRIDKCGGLQPSYVRSMMLIVNAALKYAAEEGWCAPLKTQICKPIAGKKELKILKPEEQRKLEQYITRHMDLTGLGVLLSLYTGLRIGEICALAWSNVDLEHHVLHIRHTLSRTKKEGCMCLVIEQPKTYASFRDIPIPSFLVPILMEYKKCAKSAFVISDTETFVNPRTFEYRYHRLLQCAGISNINYHALRHTFATRCIQAGVDIKSLSEILGHSNTSITMNIYVHSSMEIKRSQMEKLQFLI